MFIVVWFISLFNGCIVLVLMGNFWFYGILMGRDLIILNFKVNLWILLNVK